MPADTVTIVGVGLLGGSIGLALRRGGLAHRVVGLGRERNRLQAAIDRGAIDIAETDPARAFADASIVVVCTPVACIAADVIQAAALAPTGCLITDVGSTKSTIVNRIESDAIAAARFVGAHPIAGSELNGVEHARADLFQNAVCVITRTPRTPSDQWERARAFWSALGCRPIEMSPDDHDAALARTSHLPHVAAAALARLVPQAWLELAGGAFRDTTRVAASDAALWTDIFLHNRAATLESLDALVETLSEFRNSLDQSDAAAIRSWWDTGRGHRAEFNRSQTRQNDDALSRTDPNS